MANTSVTYTGDGAQKTYAVPFPYINKTHVKVELDTIDQLDPSDYSFQDATNIVFVIAPALNSGIKFTRETPGATRLVDFQPGSVLTEADLDLSANQNFFLAQETRELYAELVNAELVRIATSEGIVDTDPALMIASLVDTILADQTASDLQAALADIDTNAESILDNTDLLQLIGDANPGRTAFILDEVTIEVDGGLPGGSTLANKFSAIVAVGDTNAAAVITEQTARIAADDAEAVLRVVVEARVTVNEGDIDTNAAAVVTEQTARISADDAEAALRVTLAARVTVNEGDIDGAEAGVVTNAADIVTEQTVRADADTVFTADWVLLGARNGASTAFILDSNTIQIDSDGTDTLSTILARHAVAIDVNGYITGYELISDGTLSAFSVLVDKFQVVHPSTVWAASTAYSIGQFVRPTSPTSPSRVFKCTTAGTSSGTEPAVWNTTVTGTTADNDVVWTTFDDAALVPFTVEGGSMVINSNVIINGNLLVAGTVSGLELGLDAVDGTHVGDNVIDNEHMAVNSITAIEINVADLAAISADIGSITAGDIVLDANGFIRGGQSGYDTGSGFWLGNDGGTYKFSIGDGGTNRLTWDGTTLVIRGNLSVGDYTASDTLMLSADTSRTNTGTSDNWTEFKKFELNRPGTVRVTFDGKLGSISGGLVSNGSIRTKLDGIVKNTATFGTASFVAKSFDLTVGDDDVFVTMELQDGERNTSEPVDTATTIRNARIKADKSDGEAVITD